MGTPARTSAFAWRYSGMLSAPDGPAVIAPSGPPLRRFSSISACRTQYRSAVSVRSSSLVDDLLDVSRITRGLISLDKALVDLRRVVEHAVVEIGQRMDARHLSIRSALPATSLFVEGDATRLEQVLINLLGNSVKFTPAGGRIDVILERQDGEAQLTVADNGIGIAPEVLPTTIFDVFVQAKGGPDRAKGGIGLGLTLVRRIVELHSGTVSAESAGLNQGTKFVVRLPAVPEAALRTRAAHLRSGAPHIPPAARAPGASRRILVVDDNRDVATSIADLLRMEGHGVETSGDGPSAIAAARAFKPQVVLLDIGLPDMDGYEVARQMRALLETRTALLVAVSGYGQDLDRSRSLAAGFDEYLVKPTDLARLESLISADAQLSG